jgi:hypothetical protein
MLNLQEKIGVFTAGALLTCLMTLCVYKVFGLVDFRAKETRSEWYYRPAAMCQDVQVGGFSSRQSCVPIHREH